MLNRTNRTIVNRVKDQDIVIFKVMPTGIYVVSSDHGEFYGNYLSKAQAFADAIVTWRRDSNDSSSPSELAAKFGLARLPARRN